MSKNNFSIQDWKSNHFYDLIEESIDEVGSMKTKSTANPHAGKWRIVSADTNRPLTDKFYDSEKEAKAASEKLGQVKSSGIKIIQLPDTMKVYTKESSHIPSSTTTTSVQDTNMGHGGNPTIKGLREDALQSLLQMFPGIDQGEMDNDFFIDLFDALAAYFAENAEELSNMDAMGIARHCQEASRAIKGRSGN